MSTQITQPQTDAALANDGSAGRESCELPIKGMTCAACAARIEKNLKRAEGVRSAAVNFATNRATVEYDPKVTSKAGISQVIQDTGEEGRQPPPQGARL